MELPHTRRRAGALVLVPILLAAQSAPAAVGRTPGFAAVTGDGEASYSIPLQLPPGTNGMTPSLSLEYRHRSPGGLLGIGWSIGGLSQISRCPRTIAQDGIPAPVPRSDGERLCLDGQRLVVVNAVAYGAPGAEYRTEIESFARIRSIAGSGPAPRYFTVETADGRVLEYGATADSRIDWSTAVNPVNSPRIWALNRIRDRSGNVIDFQYTENTTNGSFRIAEVRYNSNPGAGVAASHRVTFIHETRASNEVDSGYVPGTPVRQVVRLDRVDVLHETTVLRRYDLAYGPALTASGDSRLAAVHECGRNGGDCLAPTTFTWQEGTSGFGAATVYTTSIPAWTGGLTDMQVVNTADINGDGRDDLILLGGASRDVATIRYRLAQPNGDLGPEVNTGVSGRDGIGTPFDHDGDGRSDLLMISPSRHWQVLPGTASGFGQPMSTGVAAAWAGDYRGLDLNGDGLGDIAWTEQASYSSGSIAVRARYAIAGGGYSPSPVTLYEQQESQDLESASGGSFLGRPGEPLDLDRDGADDLVLEEPYTLARITRQAYGNEGFEGSPSGGTVLDMNGDDCADFAHWHHSGRLRIRPGGCWVNWDGTELQGPAWSGNVNLRAHDWNDDGRDDLLLVGPANWHVAISNGDSFTTLIDTGIAHGGATFAAGADVNGDGLRDLVTRKGSEVRLRLRNGPKANLMLEARDGFGVAAAFAYRPLTDAAIYLRGPDAAWPEQVLQSPAYVVTEMARTDGTGTGSRIAARYAYEGMRRHLLGRGSLGFAKRTATETDAGGQSGLTSVETYRQDYPFTGLPATLALRQPSGTPVSGTTLQWTALALGSGASLRRYPYASSTTTRRHELGGNPDGAEIAIATRAIAAIDATSGLVTDETLTVTETGGGSHAGSSASLRTLHTGVLNDTANWCVGRPLATQVTASHTLAGGEASTRSFDQTWDAQKCRVTQARSAPGSSQWQVALQLAYDSFGNVATRSVIGAGMNPRTTTLQWGARGQSLASVSNALQQTYALAWDLASGLPASMTDPNGLAIGWTYDAHGRLAQENHPQGTSTLWTRDACPGACDARTRYRIAQLDRDAAGVAQVTTTVDVDQHDRAFRLAVTSPGGGSSVQQVDADPQGRASRRYLPHWAGGTPPGYWQAAYDLLGRTTTISLHAANGAAQRVHELRHEGLSVSHVDPLGRLTRGTRTAWGTPVEVVDAAAGRTRYEYDAYGGLLRVYDAMNNLAASVAYNPVGMPMSQTEMNSGTWTYVHNALGELLSLRDARSQSMAFAYDLLGRLASRTTPEGTSTLTWGNSAASRNIGRLSAIAGPDYSEGYLYDGFGRLAARTITSDATYRYDYTYDSFGLPASLTYPATGSGSRFALLFDHQQGQLAGIRDAAAPARAYWRLGAQDAAGNVIDEMRGTSLRIVSGFDPLTGLMDYRQSSAAAGQLQDLAYDWDANDNLVERRDLRQGLIEDFRYDVLDRLDDARRNGLVNLDLDYDALGNIRWKSDVCATTTPCYGYHATKRHAATAVAGKAFAYDANGNMASRAGGAIGWNSANLPVSITGAGGSSQFWYGPAGNRWKQLAVQEGTTETTVYVGELMEKVVRAGVTTWRHYIPAPGGIAAVQLRTSGGAAPVTRYLAQDHLGSTDRVLDEAGNLLAAGSFAPFGARRGLAWSGAPSAAELATLAAVTRDGFTGHEHLDHLGLVHLGGRVYDPHLGRFLSADPFVTAPFNGQSLNRYSYVWNNPPSLVDPSGYDPETPCVESAPNTCARVTVIGVEWADVMRALFAGGNLGGARAQVASASERDPCGQDSSMIACAYGNGLYVSPASVVLTVGTQADSTLSRNADLDRLHGFAARLANLAISAAPVTWLFGANPGFEWFDVPDSAAGQSGATIGNVGYFLGGFGGIVRNAGMRLGAAGAPRGRVVLGHYPEYLALAQKLGSRSFNVPRDIRAKMSAAERWAANQRFLDRIVARGDDVVMSTYLGNVRPGSTLERELQYLIGRGYQVLDDGWRLSLWP